MKTTFCIDGGIICGFGGKIRAREGKVCKGGGMIGGAGGSLREVKGMIGLGGETFWVGEGKV